MKKRSKIGIMFKMLGLVAPLSGYMILAIIMGIISNLCASSITVWAGMAVMRILGFVYYPSTGVIFGCMIGCSVARGILRYAEQSCNHFIAFKLLAHIRDRVFGALRRLCPAKLEGRGKGELINIITSDIELLEVFYAHTISPIIIAAVFYIIVCCFIGSFYYVYGIIAAVSYVLVGVIMPLITSKISGSQGMKIRSKAGDLAGFMLDNLRGINETIQYDCGKARMKGIADKTDELINEDRKLKRLGTNSQALSSAVIMLADLVMVFYALFCCYMGRVDLDGVIIPVLTLMSTFGPAVALTNLGTTLQNTLAACERVLDILDEEPVTEEITGKENIEFTGAALDHVTFSYDNKECVLKDVSMDFPAGQITGISGKSGSGKSTILKMLQRFWKVNSGTAVLSGKSVEEINTLNLREMEAYVTQETYLYHDSIANNLRLAKLDASQEEIEEACKKASVHDFIMSLKDGYDTSVLELGSSLSGGERQRLGLARAFLHGAPLLLLDEPTSNLDSLNEAVILKALKREKGEHTIILVSHRESTMKIADKVIKMDTERAS